MQVLFVLVSGAVLLFCCSAQVLPSGSKRSYMTESVGAFPITGAVMEYYEVSPRSHYRRHLCTGTLVERSVVAPMECIMPVIMKEYNRRGFLPFNRTSVWTFRAWTIENQAGANYFKLIFSIPRFRSFAIQRVVLPVHPGKWQKYGYATSAARSDLPKYRYSTSLAILQFDNKTISDVKKWNTNEYHVHRRIYVNFFYTRPSKDYVDCHIQTLAYSDGRKFRYRRDVLNERVREEMTIHPVEILDADCERLMANYHYSMKLDYERYFIPLNRTYDNLCVRIFEEDRGMCRGDEGAPILCRTVVGQTYWFILGVVRQHFRYGPRQSCRRNSFPDVQHGVRPKGKLVVPVSAFDLRAGSPLGHWVEAMTLAENFGRRPDTFDTFPRTNMRWTRPTTTDSAPNYFVG